MMWQKHCIFRNVEKWGPDSVPFCIYIYFRTGQTPVINSHKIVSLHSPPPKGAQDFHIFLQTHCSCFGIILVSCG